MTQTPPVRTLRATSPADLLALVPAVLGFHPAASLVLLTIGDAASPVHARIDLPADTPSGRAEVAAHLTDVVLRNGVRRLAAVVYSGDGPAADALVATLDEHLLAAGVDLVVAVRADDGRWWVVGDPAPGPGTPYDVRSHPFLAEAVLAGTVVHRDRGELAASLAGGDPAEVARVDALAEEVLMRLADVADHPLGPAASRRHLATEGRWVRHRLRRHLGDGARLDDADAARMLVLVWLSVEVRDVAWAEATPDTAKALVELWRDLLRRAPTGLRAAPASLLAFAAWLSGHGALAWCGVEAAQADDPGYSMAGLLSTMLAGGVPPSSWQPWSADELPLFAHDPGL